MRSIAFVRPALLRHSVQSLPAGSTMTGRRASSISSRRFWYSLSVHGSFAPLMPVTTRKATSLSSLSASACLRRFSPPSVKPWPMMAKRCASSSRASARAARQRAGEDEQE